MGDEKSNLDSSDLAINYLADMTCDTCIYGVFTTKGQVSLRKEDKSRPDLVVGEFDLYCACSKRRGDNTGTGLLEIANERTCEFWHS